jgi:RHS repeat-associated protein
MSYAYDGSLLEKTVWSGLIAGNVSVTYNDDLMVTSQSVNDGNTVSYGYDDDGLLVAAGSLTVSRDGQNGMLTGCSIGSVSDNVAYNGFGELQQYQAKYGGSTVYNVDYGTRDKLGRVVTKTETVNGETHAYSYVYDPNTDELTDVYKDGALVSHYDYDANGNRVRYAGADGTFNGTYDDQDRLLSYGGNTYQYTVNGELKSKTSAEGTTVYDYDVLGNLRAVTLADGTKIDYIIDGGYRRIGKKVNGALVQGFLYQNFLNPVAEIDTNGDIVARFIYATGINVPDYMVKNGVTYRIVTDHLGSPRVIINTSTGEVVQRLDYDEFGNVTLDTNPGFQPFGFAGGLYDQHNKLVHFGLRDYDPETGRWTCKDPIGFGGGETDLYAYCGNDPINFIDPTGEGKILKRLKNGAIGAVSGAASGAATGAVTGAVVGSLAGGVGAAPGAAAGATAGALAGGVSGLISGLMADPCDSVGDVAKGGAISGGISGALAGAGGAAAAANNNITNQVITRNSLGADGASSRHIMERMNGEVISKTHQVQLNGKIIHQHQTFIGKYGTEYVAPEQWVNYPTIGGK